MGPTGPEPGGSRDTGRLSAARSAEAGRTSPQQRRCTQQRRCPPHADCTPCCRHAGARRTQVVEADDPVSRSRSRARVLSIRISIPPLPPPPPPFSLSLYPPPSLAPSSLCRGRVSAAAQGWRCQVHGIRPRNRRLRPIRIRDPFDQLADPHPRSGLGAPLECGSSACACSGCVAGTSLSGCSRSTDTRACRLPSAKTWQGKAGAAGPEVFCSPTLPSPPTTGIGGWEMGLGG